jgi:hypothetical protein
MKLSHLLYCSMSTILSLFVCFICFTPAFLNYISLELKKTILLITRNGRKRGACFLDKIIDEKKKKKPLENV